MAMSKTIRNVIVGAVLLAVLGSTLLVFGVRYLMKQGLFTWADNEFGDQHLKTTVALVELHRVRYGHYPRALTDLKFLGSWDPIALSNVSYAPSEDLSRYYVEVRRGWIGRPSLSIPAEFWQGTGYDPQLRVRDQR